MLLTILNLPYTVTYNDIKSLVYSKCGIGEIILDNLAPHDNRTKKVTIGVSGDEDAAIFMKKINGAMMNGHKLQVVWKNKTPQLSLNMNQGSSQAGTSGSMQSYGLQASSWSPGLNLKPPPPPGMQNQAVPTMVPPPGAMPYGGANMYYPNQHAYYMMNQPAYSSAPTGPNIGYQTVPYGNMGNMSNQGYSQNPWSNNNWNQQQQSGGLQSAQSKKEREEKWDNSHNSGSKWDNSGSKWDNSGSKWDNNESKWDNNDSKWDNSDSKWDNGDSNWDNSGSKWDNNPEPERDNSRESRWNNNNSSNWDDNRGLRSNNSNDSKWQSNRDSNRDSYRPNQSAGSTRDQNVSYRSSDQNNSPRPSQNVYRNHVTYSSGDRYNQRDNEPQQNRYKSVRQRSSTDRDRYQSPPPKRPRNTQPDFVPGGPVGNKGNKPPTERQLQLGRMWRGKFIVNKARQILSDPQFEYEAPDPEKLLKALQSNVRKRLNTLLGHNITMPIEQIEKQYNKAYGYKTNWESLRDSLQQTGGQMLSKLETRPVVMQPLFKNKNKSKKKKGPKVAPQVPQFGLFGNLKVDHRFEKQGSTAGPSQATQKSWLAAKLGGNNPQGIPLAMIPGRIPQYPWGDKFLYKRQKKEQNEMMAGDLSSKIFDNLKPMMKKAIEEEVESLCAKITEVVDNPDGDEKTGMFCDALKAGVPPELKRAMRLNVARRILPVLPIKIRVFASPPVSRLPLEEFLKDYNVSTLLKSVKQPYYVADCNTIAEHDKLCTMEAVKIGNSVVHFKPFHMVDTQKKGKHIDKRRTLLAKVLVENTPITGIKNEPQPNDDGGNNRGSDEHVEQENECYTVVKNENLCKKMKNIHEQINKIKQNIELEEENEEYHENEKAIEEMYLSGKQFTDNQDFSNDVDVDYVLDSPKGGSGNKRKDESANNQNGSDKKSGAENINMVDVNDDDLVDW